MKFSYVATFFTFALLSCKPVYEVKKTEQTEYLLSDSTNTLIDSSVYTFILPYKQKMEGAMSAVVAESEYAMERGTPESRLGNFVADACMIESSKIFYPSDGRQADFAFFNNGGLRRPLPKGKITRRDVFELMPFENELVVLNLDGGLVKKIFNFIAAKDGAPVSGVRFEIKNHEAVNITIHDQPLDTLKTYKGLTSDYIANGGESFDFILNVPRESVNLKMRDAILQYMMAIDKEGKKISVNTDGRISNAR
jgi:2',3'-cyclic-nucleotide 2'-phosphodiesterase (5'-nucleotidase family)